MLPQISQSAVNREVRRKPVLVRIGVILLVWSTSLVQLHSEQFKNNCIISNEVNSLKGKKVSEVPSKQEALFTEIMKLVNATAYYPIFIGRGSSLPTSVTNRVTIIIGDNMTVVGIWCG